jgi:alkylation response protein AidB-like acyl-CoA dehydrogenase
VTSLDDAGLAAGGPLAASSAAATCSGLEAALAEIAAGAGQRDAAQQPEFPAEAFRLLRDVGALSFNCLPGEARPRASDELALVRRVACADGSVGRIFDGHLNAVERLAVQAPAELRDLELEAVRTGGLLAGVWGGDPVADEGEPATVVRDGTGEVLRGVKTFCSGAGGLDRAAVLARAERGGPPLLVWIDVADLGHVEVDPSWYRAHGLAASVSHRVIFHDAPVLARLGPAGAISAQPWFGRDALRTAASWAGMADTAVAAALATLAERPSSMQLEALAAGRILTAQNTIGVWLDHAAAAMDRAADDLGSVALHARAAIAACCRELLDEAARACGSRPFARAQALDRARRDLELFLLQHGLDPLLAREGARVLDELANADAGEGGRA